jgi:hypothetical protein
MNYKKAWNTLKAESGYRQTLDGVKQESFTVKELMELMEKRVLKEG